MKYYVRICSVIAFVFLLFVNVSGIGGLCQNIAYYVYEMKHPVKANGTIDGAPTPFLNELSERSQAVEVRIKIVVLVICVIIFLAENVWRFYLAHKLRKEKKFKYYKRLSITGILEIVINAVILLAASQTPTEYYDYETHPVKYMGHLNGPIFGLYLFMIFWLILNILSAKQCEKDGL